MRAARDVFCVHALNRCFERLGFVPSVAEAVAVHDAITTRRATLLKQDHDGRQRWLVSIRGVDACVIYQPQNNTVVTVLETFSDRTFQARRSRADGKGKPPSFRSLNRHQLKAFWRHP